MPAFATGRSWRTLRAGASVITSAAATCSAAGALRGATPQMFAPTSRSAPLDLRREELERGLRLLEGRDDVDPRGPRLRLRVEGAGHLHPDCAGIGSGLGEPPLDL